MLSCWIGCSAGRRIFSASFERRSETGRNGLESPGSQRKLPHVRRLRRRRYGDIYPVEPVGAVFRRRDSDDRRLPRQDAPVGAGRGPRCRAGQSLGRRARADDWRTFARQQPDEYRGVRLCHRRVRAPPAQSLGRFGLNRADDAACAHLCRGAAQDPGHWSAR